MLCYMYAIHMKRNKYITQQYTAFVWNCVFSPLDLLGGCA